ncbi:MAG: AAA family ATPase [Nitrosopumilus sp.]|uniref:AAA family ATPase n=1 Tax=Nitrosopumilus sp. TaxID=2024843 RepID=UPI00247D08A7|nr:AAA family ATPase [Nitrosopumilus sp.]MCV0392522.1 AAA family ATPase [Nitrosopumilus sp.]
MTSNFRIQRIKIHNFKNFRDLDLELEKLNVIVGQNASGKSNFKQIFSFLKDIVTDGLDDAISYQGGSEYLRNFSSKDMTLKMEIHFVSDEPNEVERIHPRGDYAIVVTTKKIVYKFALQFFKNSNYKIIKDELIISGSFEDESQNKILSGNIIFSKHGKDIKQKYDFPSTAGSILQRQYEIFEFSPLTDKQLLLEAKLFGFMVKNWYDFLNTMGIYDFDPRSLKSPSGFRSGTDLHYNGSNLSFILNQINQDPKKRKTLTRYVHDMLPFFKSISIERTTDGSLRFNLNETYNSKKMPAIYVSDGTVNVIALTIVLFLQNNHLTFIEEPERNIHPGILSNLVQLFDDASEENQIIVTTHNTNILDHIKLENILIVSRNTEGDSNVIKPINDEELKKFKKVMSMKYLMTQNMLG